jgi:hypothetical protein
MSPAGVAAVIETPVWIVDLLIDLGAITAHRVQGQRRIRHRELEALRRNRDPQYRRNQ